MRIAVFHNLPTGGARRVMDNQVRYLSDRHDVSAYNFNFAFGGPRPKRDYDNFVTLRRKHKALAEKIDARKHDAVLVHPDKLTQAPFILRFLATPSLYYCHEWLRIAYEPAFAFKEKVATPKRLYEQLTRLVRKRIDRDNAASATSIVCNSGYTADNAFAAYGKMSKVAHPGVDTKVFKPSGKKREKQLIFVGGETNFNGYPLAKKVAELAGFRLKVITGFKLSDAQLAEEYSKSTAALCLSRNEPFGLVALEAMSCETPVLAANEGGYRETVIDGRTGYLLPRNPEAFVEKLGSLPRHMGKKGREHVKKNFTWEKHGKILEECLKSLLQ